MPVEVRVPTMGESVVEATIGRWLKQEGEAVSVGEALVELETDKVNTELPADDAGVLERILRREGETVKVGDPLAVINAEARAKSGVRKADSGEREKGREGERGSPNAGSQTLNPEPRTLTAQE